MSRGYRSEFLALGVATLLAIIAGILIYREAAGLQHFYESQAEQHAQEYRDSPRVNAERACARLIRSEVRECVYKEYEAAREGERREYDLQAQLVTSAWTRAMGLAAGIAMAVGILGVGLVYTTFNATREANEIGRAATIDQIAANRPLMQLDTEDSWAEAVPADSPFHSTGIGPVEHITMRYRFKNYGTQPCWIEAAWIGFIAKPYVGGRADIPSEIPDQFRVMTAGFILPGQSVGDQGGLYGIVPEYKGVIEGGAACVVMFGLCQYRSPAGHLFSTRFAYTISLGKKIRPEFGGIAVNDPAHWKDGRVKEAKLKPDDPVEYIV